jgi:hypothetical protein
VTLIDRLRSVIRETRSRRTENALRDLDSETEASLMLLEVLGVLEQLGPDDNSIPNGAISISKKKKNEKDENDPSQHKRLSYEQFIAGRRPRLTHNSLAGSEVSLVRGFLNHILGMTGDDHDHDDVDDDEGALKGLFDLGDETENAEAAIASGQEFDTKPKTPDEEEQAKAALQNKAAQRKATKDQIVGAANSFVNRVTERQDSGALDNHDVLRLRALLMIICAASWAGSDKSGKQDRPRSSLQVLSAEEDMNSWPFVMGRLLFKFFGGRVPAIRHLYLSGDHDQIPSDIVECWATCYWCLQAAMNAPVSPKEHARIAGHLELVAAVAYRLTLPKKSEILGDDVLAVMDGMSSRYAEKLGIKPAVIRWPQNSCGRAFSWRPLDRLDSATSA